MEFFCESIFPMEEGEFTLWRDHIMGGIRFSMLDCPNAQAWTINRDKKQEEIVEEIHMLAYYLCRHLGTLQDQNLRLW